MIPDVVVIGAGTVGAAIAYGLAGRNLRVLVLDGGDRDFRAASANFGLVWQHGKGIDLPEYHQLTRDAVDRWPDFDAELTELTGADLQYEHNGGLNLCLSEAEFEQRRATLMRLHNQVGGDPPDWEMLDRDALGKLLPNIAFGPDVAGASFGCRDGQTNPLRLLAALHEGILRRGGEIRGGCIVRSITANGAGYELHFGQERVSVARVVIAAGLGSKILAAQTGLDIPVRPQRGQILVTERLEPFLSLPMMNMRQTREGSVMLGATNEEAGFDSSTTNEAAAAISARGVRCVPAVGEANLVRQWAGLRIMTPDGFPVYAESQTHPGVFVAQCHSGVTLASMHAEVLADAIAAGCLPQSFDVFHQRRFNVQKAA